jgi:hypothetical protein
MLSKMMAMNGCGGFYRHLHYCETPPPFAFCLEKPRRIDHGTMTSPIQTAHLHEQVDVEED